MNGYYGTQGPAEWAQQKQGQQYNTLQNMINMLMRVKMMKHQEQVEKGRFEQEQEFKEKQLESLEKQRKAQRDQWAKPKIPDFVQKAMALEQYPADTPQGQNIRKLLHIKNPEDELKIQKELIDYRAKTQAKYRKPDKPPSASPFFNKMSTNVNTEIKRLRTKGSKTTYDPMTGGWSTTGGEKEDPLVGIWQSVGTQVVNLSNKDMTNALTPEDRKQAARLNSLIAHIKKEEKEIKKIFEIDPTVRPEEIIEALLSQMK